MWAGSLPGSLEDLLLNLKGQGAPGDENRYRAGKCATWKQGFGDPTQPPLRYSLDTPTILKLLPLAQAQV